MANLTCFKNLMAWKTKKKPARNSPQYGVRDFLAIMVQFRFLNHSLIIFMCCFC